MPLTKTAPATPTFAYDKRLNTEFAFTRTLRMLALTGRSSKFHWKND
jgi:hypothetical protein